jgi:hypothetical protein
VKLAMLATSTPRVNETTSQRRGSAIRQISITRFELNSKIQNKRLKRNISAVLNGGNLCGLHHPAISQSRRNEHPTGVPPAALP